MPLPLPNLDTRRWADLVEEGRALIPRYAPGWTDHNVTDPGITLIELFALQFEAEIYRTNRISARHRRKFLQLVGFPPHPPQPARVVLQLRLKPGKSPQRLPAGVVFGARVGGTQLPFRTLVDLIVVDAAIIAVQTTMDGKAFTDQTRAYQGRFGFPLWEPQELMVVSSKPEEQPAIYIGFDKALPVDQAINVRFHFAGPRANQVELRRILEEARAAEASCTPPRSARECAPLAVSDQWCLHDPEPKTPQAPQASSKIPPHHSIRTVWEYFDGNAWKLLSEEQGKVLDETRGFTLDGTVIVTLPTAMKNPASFGVDKDDLKNPRELFYLRCRLEKGALDFASRVVDIQLNAVLAEQVSPERSAFEIKPGVVPAAGKVPKVGELGHLNIEFDERGVITKLAFFPDGDGPHVRVLAYEAAKPNKAGSLVITLALIGWGTGLPDLKVTLRHAPVAEGRIRLWTVTDGKAEEWTPRPDLDASGRTDAHFVLNPTTGEIAFGDGEHGRVAPWKAAILASSDFTSAGLGHIIEGARWGFKGADDVMNGALLLPETVDDVEQQVKSVQNVFQSYGGTDEEELDHAAGRAAEVVSAHERLLELCQTYASQTLDGLEPGLVFSRAAPPRATTLVDYERLALDVPGAPIARARAWAGLEPDLPCVTAPGTVVVTIVPWLPVKRPSPSAQLLAAIQRYLDRCRLVGTRLVVVGPYYLEVKVRAQLVLTPGAASQRVTAAVSAALDRFLNSLQGGPNGRGWPFGRDVYGSEILEVIDQTPEVDHVEDLELVGGTGEAQCGNLCVGPLMLVTPGVHEISVLLGKGANGTTKS